MLPDNTLSPTAIISGFSFPVKSPSPVDRLQDWELAGVYLNDPSQGLLVKLWHAQVVLNHDTGQLDVMLDAPGGVHVGVPSAVLFSGEDITEIALSFDQNMNPFVAYMQAGEPKIYWYDPLIPGMTHTVLPAGCYDLRCTLDDKRLFNVTNSDIVLSYIRAGNLCVRYQRERYVTEHILRAGVGGDARLVSMAMNRGSRMQWRIRNYALIDDPGALLQADPFLADIVADLLRRSDVKAEHIDTDQLWVPVEGYRIANEGGADANIAPLQAAWFFDPGEWDKKLRFVMRGGSPVAHITFNDLLERDDPNGPMQMERVQEMELLRKVNITTVDSTAGWVPNKQTAERRSATIKARGESSSIVPITATPDFTATIATKRLRVPWGEPHKFNFKTGVWWSKLTATDVVTYEDRRGRVHQIRLGQIEEDYGSLQFEATTNAGWLYGVTATGANTKPWVPQTPGQAGDTVVVVLDLPVLRDQDDELGYYVAVYGTGDGWNGGVVQLSLDGGATIAQSIEVDVPAAVGSTGTALAPEVSGEYLGNQVLRVLIDDPLESVDREAILRYRNLAAVQHSDGSWEMLQYQTVTPIDSTTFDLSGLVRARYATKPLAIDAGARFVVFDGSVMFVQLQQWMLGQTASYRGISYGQNPDDVPWQSFAINNPLSQTEWPVHGVGAVRDGSNNVTVSWVGRARLGVEVAPRNSKYFTGYRVTYSDGYTADTADMQHTRAATPAGVTITVAAINSITGPGPSSEGITI